MKVRIHRGTREIGGTCIEVEAQGKRIALDVGLPLDAPDNASDGAHERLLPAVSGFRGADDSLLGVVISHPQLDHYGLARYLRPSVPVYIGEAAYRILQAASASVPNGHSFEGPRFITDRVSLEISPFRITPYLRITARSIPTRCCLRRVASASFTWATSVPTVGSPRCSRRS